jgi:hypothetical protein
MTHHKDKVDTKLDYWANRLAILNDEKYKDARVAIVENLNWVVNNLVLIFSSSKKYVSRSKLGYMYFVRIPLVQGFNPQFVNNETPHILLLVEPYDCTRPFVEFQFKGQPYNINNWATSRVILENIIGHKTYKEVFGCIETVGLDVRVDVDKPLDSFVYDCLKARTSATYFKNGLPKTYYFNSKRSPFRVGIYSRVNKKSDISQSEEGCFDTRIEMRQRALKLPIREVINEVHLVKKFQRFKVYDFKQMEKCKFLNFYFLLSCKLAGLKPIIERLSKSEKRKVKEELKRYEIIIVNQNLIEKQLQKYMNLSSILDPENSEFEDLLEAERIKLKGLFS